MIKNFYNMEDILADEDFLAWYFNANKEQAMKWEQWLAKNPQQQSLVTEAIEFMNSFSGKELSANVSQTEEKLRLLNNRINELETPVVRMNSSRKKWWMSAAAAILILAGTFTLLKTNSSKPILNTTYGQVSSNKLPDGSTMILNANSTAKLSKGWEKGKDREVWLNGEAFFKITKTPEKSRFIVHTGDVDIIVTGTQFNVMHRDSKTIVLLTEGSVILRTSDGKELAMKPGDYVEMGNKVVERKEKKEENVLAWKDNKMAFDNTSLEEVAHVISNHYGVKVTLADTELMTKSLTGIMPNNNLEVLLKAIEMGTDIIITRTDEEIIFSANNK
jgi:transmembrane sensor